MWRLLILLLPTTAAAESLVATRTIRAQTVISAEDVTLVAAAIPGALNNAADAVGQEAKVAIYAGRPVLATAVGPAAVVERNQIVSLSYMSGPLAILTEGRALDRGGVGDVIQVMNLASRNTVAGRVSPNGTVEVGSGF